MDTILDTGVSTPMRNDSPAEYRPIVIDNIKKKAYNNASGFQVGLKSLDRPPNLLASLHGDNKAFKNTNGIRHQAETHNQLSDGSWVPKYESFIWGTDNEERLASGMSRGEKWSRGIKKAGASFVSSLASGTVGVINGLGAASAQGEFEAMYNNRLTDAIMDWQETVNSENLHYYSKEEKDSSVLGSLMYANTWSDQFLNGVGYMAGAIASEAVWAGLATVTGGAASVGLGANTAGIAARIGLLGTKRAAIAGAKSGFKRAAKRGLVRSLDDGIESAAQFANLLGKQTGKKVATLNSSLKYNKEAMELIMKGANNAHTRAKLLHSGRFMLSSSLGEATIEANHFIRANEQDFLNHHRLNGTAPSDKEYEQFFERSQGAGNNVFKANVAILAPSNMAMFGHLFKANKVFKNMGFSSIGKLGKSINQRIDKNLFKLGTKKTADGTYKAIKSNILHKAAKHLTRTGKGVLTEGFWEEGGQGIASSMFANYIKASYDPANFGQVDTLMESFYHSVGEQYTSKEGLKEVMIGGLIGGGMSIIKSLGNSGINSYSFQKKVANTQNEIEQSVKNPFGLYSRLDLSSKVGRTSRDFEISDNLEKAVSEGDLVAEDLHRTELVASKMQQGFSVGKEDFFENTLYETIDNLEYSDVSKQEGFENMTEDEFQDYKEAIKGDISSKVNNYKQSRKFAESIFGEAKIGGITKINNEKGAEEKLNTQNLVDATAYAMTMGLELNNSVNDIFTSLNTALNEIPIISENKARIKSVLAHINSGEELIMEREKLLTRIKQVEQQIEDIKTGLVDGGNTINQEQRNSIARSLERLNSQLQSVILEKEEIDRVISKLSADLGTSTAELGNEKLESQLEAVEEILSSVSKKDQAILRNMIATASKAINHRRSFDKMTNNLLDPEFTFRTYEGLFGGIVRKTMSVNEFTEKALKEWLDPSAKSPGSNFIYLTKSEKALKNITDVDLEAIRIARDVKEGRYTMDEVKEFLVGEIESGGLTKERKDYFIELLNTLSNSERLLQLEEIVQELVDTREKPADTHKSPEEASSVLDLPTSPIPLNKEGSDNEGVYPEQVSEENAEEVVESLIKNGIIKETYC